MPKIVVKLSEAEIATILEAFAGARVNEQSWVDAWENTAEIKDIRRKASKFMRDMAKLEVRLLKARETHGQT